MAGVLDLARNETGIATAIEVLRQRLGPRVETGQALREQHAHTTTWLRNQPPDAVICPTSTAEVQEIVAICAEYRVPVIPFGTGSSLEGQVNAPSGGITLDFKDMNAILQVNADDMDVVIQPGVTRKALNTHLRDTGLFFPVDPGADASLGGMAATGASGTNAVRYGTMKDNVLALKAVLPSGEVLTSASRARKSSAGYDLTRLMVGSEGTLGIITELTLRLRGIPEAVSGATCSFPTVAAACNAVIATIQYGLPVARIELLDALQVRAVNAYSKLALPEAPLLLLEFHGSATGVAEQAETFGEIAADMGGTGFTFTTREEDRARLWQARHDAYWAGLQLRPGCKGLSTDVCVPAVSVWRMRQRLRRNGRPPACMIAHRLVRPCAESIGNFHCCCWSNTDSPAEVAQAESLHRLAQRPGDLHGRHLHRRGGGETRDRAGQGALIWRASLALPRCR